jgi:hypothetical protein
MGALYITGLLGPVQNFFSLAGLASGDYLFPQRELYYLS